MKDALEIERRFILRDNISNFENFEKAKSTAFLEFSKVFEKFKQDVWNN